MAQRRRQRILEIRPVHGPCATFCSPSAETWGSAEQCVRPARTHRKRNPRNDSPTNASLGMFRTDSRRSEPLVELHGIQLNSKARDAASARSPTCHCTQAAHLATSLPSLCSLSGLRQLHSRPDAATKGMIASPRESSGGRLPPNKP